MTEPVRFAFGLHLHQPVGNFDSVFEQHLADVYAPLLEALDRGECWPVSLHLSGPLLDWLETHAPAFLDRLGRHVAAGEVELLVAGYDEPILAVLPRADRLEQVERMREALRTRFGVDATGLWLTERVWEPDLPDDLAAAGVRYVLVDDRHFLVSGFERAALHRPFVTESGGHRVAVFPIDERLRYLVPFRPPEELAAYFADLGRTRAPLAVLADDGEKFGGWPGTKDWVYGQGWMDRFTATLRRLRDDGVVRLVTYSQALAEVASGGLAYLPSASYREMEGWALPAAASVRLAGLEAELGRERLEGPEGSLVRGSHWRHFFVKYPESNRMHKKMLALSALCRRRGEPAAARRAIGRAQCNDAYWHGVFGGLYLPHLREAIWRELAVAEEVLRRGEGIGVEVLDLDGDGHDEVWVHSDRFSAIVSPARGGAIEELSLFVARVNLANTLTRRREAYHALADGGGGAAEGEAEAEPTGGDGGPSIHDREGAVVSEVPPLDAVDRAILVERLVPAEATVEAFAAGSLAPLRCWREERGAVAIDHGDGSVLVQMRFDGLVKRLRFDADGSLSVELAWTPPADAVEALFTTELSVAGQVAIDAPGANVWRYPIETVARSEQGFDRTVQGEAVVVVWDATAASGTVRVSQRLGGG